MFLQARALDRKEIMELKIEKRFALVTVFLKLMVAQAKDDLTKIITKVIAKIHSKAKQDLINYQTKHSEKADELIILLLELVKLLKIDKENSLTPDNYSNIKNLLSSYPGDVTKACQDHLAYVGNNYLPFLLPHYINSRKVLFHCLNSLEFFTTTHDNRLIKALFFILKHYKSNKEWIPIADNNTPTELSAHVLDLNWISQKWYVLITGNSKRTNEVTKINKLYFELCTLTHITYGLQSGEICIKGSQEYDDYRKDLISWSQYNDTVEDYCEQTEISANAKIFTNSLKKILVDAAQQADTTFSSNNFVALQDGKLKLKKPNNPVDIHEKTVIENLLDQNMSTTNILDIFIDTENWLNLSRLFKPLYGFESKIADHKKRFVITLFCYGFNIGPTQTARSIKGISPRQISWLNLKHVIEDNLDRAITEVVNVINKFNLPSYWGSNETASVDATKWDLYEQNILSEYHIRYGGYGGLGYYLLSDQYIALFSHFIACGAYEASYIFDLLLNNKSDIQPKAVYGDTHSQSEIAFGFGYLFGVALMPRIRHISRLKFYRPDQSISLEHIDSIFSEEIRWGLIEKYLPDMLRIIMSVKSGKIIPSTLLRRLSSYQRKNKLYLAFRELGRVIRTKFLLNYISDIELRQMIQAGTCKSESFNSFLRWTMFGNNIIKENLRYAQQKIVKYNHLVANLIILHNVANMTQAINKLIADGYLVKPEPLSQLSPYQTKHINHGNRT